MKVTTSIYRSVVGTALAIREARALNEECQSVTKQSTHGHPQKLKEY